MASFFGGLGRGIGSFAQDQFNASPIIQTIRALRQRGQASQMAGLPTQQGVFAPRVIGTPEQMLMNVTGRAGPLGPIY